MDGMIRTFGVEEEMLLVDPADGSPVPTGEQVVRTAGARRRDRGADPGLPPIDHEFKAEQAETGSAPTTSADELEADLRRLRKELVAAAAMTGAQIAATGTSPVKVRPTPTPDDRYASMMDEFGLLARQQLTCGQHVHVGIESRAEGVAVLDRIAPWLPVVTAIAANSPFWQGQDSGYASYRTVVWSLWPTAGPAAGFGDEKGYDAAIAALLDSGASMDDGMIYFDARLSAHYPTLEIRVADVCTDVRDAVLVAVLCRALVDTMARQWQDGRPAAEFRAELLRAATWRASRFGLDADLFDPRTRRPIPAFDLVQQLVELVGPALDRTGDTERVAQALVRLRERGTGARQQREALVDGGFPGVVSDLVRRTLD